MAWTYSFDLANDPTDEVHFLVGDTDVNDPLVQNEEIDYLLTLFPKQTGLPAWLAAAAAAEAISGRFARKMDTTIGSLHKAAQQQYEHYVALAAQLRMSWATQGRGMSGFSGIRTGSPILGGGGTGVLADATTLRQGGPEYH